MPESRQRFEAWTGQLARVWPSLPFLAFGIWQAWGMLTFSGRLWLSDNELDGNHLVDLFVVNAIASGIVFFIGAFRAHKGRNGMVAGRAVIAAGVVTSLACLGVIIIGPYYLGDLLQVSVPFGLASVGVDFIVFCLLCAIMGAGSAILGMRCGVLYGSLAPRHSLVYMALSQLLVVFIYFCVMGTPRWELVAHGPAFMDILAFVGLPLVAAFLSCVPASPEVSAKVPDAAPAGTVSHRPLPASFWRFVAFAAIIMFITGVMRGAMVQFHSLATTLDGNALLMLLRGVFAFIIIPYAVFNDRPVGMGKFCSIVAIAAAVTSACSAAFGGVTNAWSLLAYLGITVFECLMWCLLAFIVYQKHFDAVEVFGIGRGSYTIASGLGWLVGAKMLDQFVGGPGSTVFFIVCAAIMLLAAFFLFSERDFNMLYSPIEEDEVALDELFGNEQLMVTERPVDEEAAKSGKGRFRAAISQIAQECSLSAREAEVFGYLAMGYGTDRVAESMKVTVNTVRAHTHNVYVKLDVHSRDELMQMVDAAIKKADSR